MIEPHDNICIAFESWYMLVLSRNPQKARVATERKPTMKRDWDVIREILLHLEDETHGRVSQKKMKLSGRTQETVDFHVDLMKEAGWLDELIIRPEMSSGGHFHLHLNMGIRPTMAGYDVLDNIRDADVWKQTKAGAKTIGSFSLDVLKELAKAIIDKKIQELTGGAFSV
jgi:hypothetical protein